MELIKAHITNFGKLSNYEVDFKSGLNTFIHENGWGKTTLSVFIKAMFYGMEYTTSKDLEKNEKLKYAPWQGGQYGGSLEFSYKGKIYLVTRSFGPKKNDDTFELRDLKTNRPSSDFTSDLGSELFGINRETYGRSVHLVLSESPAGSTDISARLNNLVEAGDVASFDKAMLALDKKATALKAKKGKIGQLFEIQTQIDCDRESLEEIKAKEIQNEEYEKKTAALDSEIEKYKMQQQALTRELTELAKFEGKLRYEGLKKDLEEAKKGKAALEAFFNGKVPEPEVLKEIDEISASYTTLAANLKSGQMTQSEKDQYESLKNYFAGDIPSKEQIDSCLKTDGQFRLFKQQESEKKLTPAEEADYKELKQKFSDKDNKSSAAAGRSSKEKSEKGKSLLPAIFMGLGFVSLLAASLCFMQGLPLLVGALAFGLAVIFFLLGFVSGRAAKTSPEELAALIQREVEFDRYSKLQQKSKEHFDWLQAQPKMASEYETELRAFVKRFCKTDDISSIPTEIQILNEKMNKFSELEKRINSSSQNIQLQTEIKEKLLQILSQYKTEKTLDYTAQVRELHDRINDLKNADAYIRQAEAKVRDFEANPQNDVKSLASLKKPEKLNEQLKAELDSINHHVNERIALRAEYQKKMNDNNSLIEKKDDIENEIERLAVEKQEKTGQHQILLQTMDFLKRAKEELDANYSDPMKEGFAKYLAMIDAEEKAGSLSKKLVIDTDLKVCLDENGKLRESQYLSDGYKDLVNFCSRMALVDALFKDEKPPVILDDPFVNLDDEKINHALALLKQMAKEKQILYFACHKSREVK
ncbi:hypothetical protein MSI_05870 [Treponema sp. JC4]|uniref:AAA family ATPase n=1 Tax=Treponema sp. JC4 TaxID=1124982 RepID=UPI00025B0BED|nr:AAA family ATPase [Treponema sp. JC4]EID85768.1 hypothetical protein MSI_05870 [Treponema sp. JC4]